MIKILTPLLGGFIVMGLMIFGLRYIEDRSLRNEEPYREVVLETPSIDPYLENDIWYAPFKASFIKDRGECVIKNFEILAYDMEDGIEETRTVTYKNNNSWHVGENRPVGEHTIDITINLGHTLPEGLEFHTRHVCTTIDRDGDPVREIKQKVFASVPIEQ